MLNSRNSGQSALGRHSNTFAPPRWWTSGPHAVRAKRTERILIGKQLSDSVIRRAAERAGAEIGGGFNSDVHASESIARR